MPSGKPVLGLWVPKPVRKGAPVECRVCFEPTAEQRECCQEPLCAHCWGSSGFCPRCDREINLVNQINVKVPPGQNLKIKDSKKVIEPGWGITASLSCYPRCSYPIRLTLFSQQ